MPNNWIDGKHLRVLPMEVISLFYYSLSAFCNKVLLSTARRPDDVEEERNGINRANDWCPTSRFVLADQQIPF